MIIRNNLVSNSSSTSFIVNGSSYKSTIALAEAMMKCREEWPVDNNICIKDMYDKLSINGLKNPNVMFPTCNYETYIAWLPESCTYAVSTCNNHNWDSITTDYRITDVLSELKDTGITNIDEMEYNLSKFFWFWSTQYDVMVQGLSEDEHNDNGEYSYCSEHWHGNYKLQGINGLFCPGCYIKNNPQGTLSMIKLRLKQGLRTNIFNIRK